MEISRIFVLMHVLMHFGPETLQNEPLIQKEVLKTRIKPIFKVQQI